MHSWLNRTQLVQRPSEELSNPEQRICKRRMLVVALSGLRAIFLVCCQVMRERESLSEGEVDRVHSGDFGVPFGDDSSDRQWQFAGAAQQPGRLQAQELAHRHRGAGVLHKHLEAGADDHRDLVLEREGEWQPYWAVGQGIVREEGGSRRDRDLGEADRTPAGT